MDKFSFDLLEKLIKNYYNSVLSKGGSFRNLKVRLTINDRELSTYTGRDAFKYIEANDAKLATLEKKGYIFIRRDCDDRLVAVELNLDAVEEIRKEIGYEDRDEILERIIKILIEGENRGFVADFAKAEIDYIKQKYKYHKSFYEDEKELISILKVLNAMVSQTEEIMERDFSVRVLGDSKALTALKNKVIAIAKRYDNSLVLGDEDNDKEVLLNYNIVKNSTYALIKGNLNFQLNDQIIELKKLGFEYSLSDAMIKQLKFLPSKFNRLITVENLTTFYNINDDNALVIFLSGFHNHTKQMLIKKIYEHFNVQNCYHFGDIDAGGFIIFNNLVKSTGIPFKPYKMGVDELKANLKHLKQLTENDKQRLLNLKADSSYSMFNEVITYMLENNVKLEQEILDT